MLEQFLFTQVPIFISKFHISCIGNGFEFSFLEFWPILANFIEKNYLPLSYIVANFYWPSFARLTQKKKTNPIGKFNALIKAPNNHKFY